MTIVQLLKTILKNICKHAEEAPPPAQNPSYSQGGEDVIAARILGRLHIATPTYLDIGANHPISLNNTYKFYENGSRGVLIEPNPALCQELRRVRPRDTVLNVGIGLNDAVSADFYVMNDHVLSTFSQTSAQEIESYGTHSIKEIIHVPLVPVNTILAEYFDACPHFVSLDAEGIDFDIVKTMDFSKYMPEVFCVETITYTEDNTEQKETELIEFMLAQGYMVYGDTYINTIFVDREKWRHR